MVERAFAEYAAARGDSVRIAAPLTQAQLDFRPRAGRWSIGEVLHHLMLAEELYRGEIGRLVDLARAGRRPYIRRTFSEVNVAPFFVPDAVLPMFDIPFSIMNRFIPQSVRDFAIEYPLVPIRNPSVSTPRAGRPAAELRAGLVSSLEQTRVLLASNGDLPFERMVSEHPLMGPANVPQILAFLARHERRHHSQIERVTREDRFPL
jgi:uncharacterized damage-inducible protein DinB